MLDFIKNIAYTSIKALLLISFFIAPIFFMIKMVEMFFSAQLLQYIALLPDWLLPVAAVCALLPILRLIIHLL